MNPALRAYMIPSSRLAFALLAVAMLAAAQAPPAKKGTAAAPPAKKSTVAARPATKSTAPAKPDAAPATPAPAPATTVQAKGFSRVEVTPQYKEQFQTEKRVAVVVAPSYRNSGLNPLRYTYVDALELKAELERQGYTVMLVSPSEATADNVRKALQDSTILLDGNNQGTMLFAFSGHGFQTAKGNYLVTVGVTPAAVEAEALSVEDVEKLMSATGARRKIIVVDACRNDPDAKSLDTPRSFSQFQEAEGTSILLSTRPGGFSYEDSDLGHGIFTYYLLEGLRGKAAGKDGFITFFDLQKYVEANVVSQSLKKDHVQRPFVMGERSGDFLLATAPPAKPEEIRAPPAASSAVDSNSMVLREMGGSRSFFAILAGNKLTLVDSKTLNPLTEVTEIATADLAPGYRHFKGQTGTQTFDLAVQARGEDIVAVKGRIGTPCPQERQCSTPAVVPLLPGEKMNTTRSTTNTVGSIADTARTGLSRLGLGGSARKADTTTAGAQTTTAAMDLSNALLKFQWKSFDLTANAPGKK